MSGTSKIEWTEATWNPVTGCTKVSQGCKNCYAERLAPKVFAGQTVEFDTTPPKHPEMKASGFRPRVFTDIRCHPERLDAPLHWKKPRRIFVNSMSDLFHEDVPDEFIDRVFAVMAIANWHTFQILTKRADRLPDYMHELYAGRMYEIAQNSLPAGWESFTANAMQAFANELPNVWLGVSVEDQATADERIPLLLQTPAAVRFLSCEPLLGPIDLQRIKVPPDGSLQLCPGGKPPARIDWVIAGGESGPKARPSHPDWFRSLRDQCAAAGVPYFFKQWGEWQQGDAVPGGDLGGESRRGSVVILQGDGREPDGHFRRGDVFMRKVGKKAAGRLLDGRTHDEYPAK